MDECKPLLGGDEALRERVAVAEKRAVDAEAGAYTRPLFGSREALCVGQGVHLGVIQGGLWGCYGVLGGVQGVF